MAHKLASAPVSESPQKPIKKIGETDRPLTIGAFLRDTVMGAGMGMLIGGVFSLAFSMGFGTSAYYPSSPQFMRRFPNQLSAVAVSFLLWVLMGIMFTWVTYIRFKSDWSVLRELLYIALCAMPCSHRLPSQRAGSRSTLHGWLYIQQYGLQSI